MTDRARVLMVCTGNICRSPAMHYLAAREWSDAADVISAGIMAEVGMDATPEIRRSAAHFDLTFPRHRPTQLTRELVERADLVLVATQSHARWIEREVGRWPTHMFGLKQAAELAAVAHRPEGEAPAQRLRGAAMELTAASRREPVPLRSLDDPWGRDQATYDRVMAEIADALSALTRWADLR